MHLLYPGDPRVPDTLWDVKRPPAQLFVQGSDQALDHLQRLPARGLAIVGTRRPKPRSLQTISSCIHELRNSDLIVISGLAAGVDTAAHQAALNANLPTIAILAGGFDHLYPPENAKLVEKILTADGLVITEFAPDVAPKPGYFIHRNRLIAHWSLATWVVEAGYKSGALNTAKWAREADRFCFATPVYPGDPSMAGNQMLLDRDLCTAAWGPHSFGKAWLELSSVGFKRAKRTQSHRLDLDGSPEADRELMSQEIRRLMIELGSAPVPELLNWAIDRGWEPGRFFVVLRAGMDSGTYVDRDGSVMLSASA